MSTLSGKKVLITAGPTQEAIDPVRYISNHSSGKMGYEIAKAFVAQHAEVFLISGPSQLTPPDNCHYIQVKSAQEMYNAVLENFKNCDIYVLAAAVADYTPKTVAKEKIKKQGDSMTIELIKTIDIAQHLGSKKSTEQLAVGFALETNSEIIHAKEKLQKKNFDFIVLNSLKNPGTCFGTDNNQISIISHNNQIDFPLKSKQAVAQDIVDHVLSLIKEKA